MWRCICVATGEFHLAVSKTVNSVAPKAKETFEFPATSTDEGAPASENITTGEAGSAAFAVAKLSDKDMGKTHTYAIHEVTELTEGRAPGSRRPTSLPPLWWASATSGSKYPSGEPALGPQERSTFGMHEGGLAPRHRAHRARLHPNQHRPPCDSSRTAAFFVVQI